MQDYFDDSHVTDVGLEGSIGPRVGAWDMLQQGFRQQYRVDSALALDAELATRWQESLAGLRAAGQNFNAPIDSNAYTNFAEYVRNGTPVTETSMNAMYLRAGLPQPRFQFDEMRRANEAIRALNNPNIKTFEQILEEVSAMQRDVEQDTASMSARTGTLGTIAEFVGAVSGSFTLRDPLNVVTAPIGAGRTVAARIATDMFIAGAVTAVTEYSDVAPNRALAGLPERDPLFNIAASTIGAGLIRGGLEGLGAGVRRLRGSLEPDDIDFDLRDTQLQQMFSDLPDSPTARAGLQALDDISFIERNNPYGEGQTANTAFLAELRQVQRLMGGEPATAVARVLPPLPFEFIEKEAYFALVKDQSPFIYARMEAAQTRLGALTEQVNDKVQDVVDDISSNGSTVIHRESIATKDEAYSARFEIMEDVLERTGKLEPQDFKVVEGDNGFEVVELQQSSDIAELRFSRQAANQEYEAAYRAVEAEATRIHDEQVRVENAQQNQSVKIFADATYGRPFNWSLLKHDFVEARVNAINTFNETVDERAGATFVRQASEGEEAAPPSWQTEDGRIDIGLDEPVDPDFRIITEDGDVSIAEIMRDLQGDADLDLAMRTCLI